MSIMNASRRRLIVRVVAVLVLLLGGLAAWWQLDDPNAPTPRQAGPVAPPAPSTPQEPLSNTGERLQLSEPKVVPATPVTEVPSDPITDVKDPEPESRDFDDPLFTVDGDLVPMDGLAGLDRNRKPVNPVERKFAVRVSGKVSTPDGKPVEGATVSAKRTYHLLSDAGMTIPSTRTTYVFPSRVGDASLSISTATTDELGNYELDVEGTVIREPAPSPITIQFAITAAADGLILSQCRGIHNYGSDPIPKVITGVDLVLCKPASVSGVVTRGDNGLPYEGAAVALTRPYPMELVGKHYRISDSLSASSYIPPPLVRHIAGPDGRFRFDGVADGEYLCWAVWPTTTHAEWRYLYKQPPQQTPQVATVTVKNGDVIDGIKLVLDRRADVVFRTHPVIDEAPGVELVDVRGSARDSSFFRVANDALQAVKQPDGSWKVAGVMAHHRALVVFAKGYLTAMAKFMPTAGMDVDLGTLDLSLGGIIDGRVVDESGRGLGGATIELRDGVDAFGFSVGHRRPPPVRSTLSDESGTFRFTGLAPRTRYNVLASLKERHSASADTLVLDTEPSVIELILSPATSVVFGRIEFAGSGNATGTAPSGPATVSGAGPVPKVPHNATIVALDATHPEVAKLVSGGSLSRSMATADRTDIAISSDWTFRQAIKPGKYRLVYRHDSESQIVDVEVAAGGEVEAIFRVGKLGSIRGKVIGPDGRALAGATVTLHSPPRGSTQVKLDPITDKTPTAVSGVAGEFEFTDLRPGPHIVWLPDYPHLQHNPIRTVPGVTSGKVTVVAGEPTELVIDLGKAPEGAAVYINIRIDGPRASITLPTLHLNGDAAKPRHSGFFMLPDRRFMANDVPAGDHVVIAHFTVMATRPVSFGDAIKIHVPRVLGEVNVTHEVKLAALSGVIELPSRAGFRGNDVKILPIQIYKLGGEATGANSQYVIPDADGKFLHTHIAHGFYRIEVQAPGLANSYQEVEIRADTHVTLTCGEPAGTMLLEFGGIEGDQSEAVLAEFQKLFGGSTFKVIDAVGKSALVNGHQHVGCHELFSDRTWRSPPITPGRVTVTVTHTMAEPTEFVVDIPSGGEATKSITITLRPRLHLTIAAGNSPSGDPESVAIDVRSIGINPTHRGTIKLTRMPDGSYSGHGYVRGTGELVLSSNRGHISEATSKITLERSAVVSHTIVLEVR